nr:hypothetical protein [Tanacetum cinerariifolium]
MAFISSLNTSSGKGKVHTASVPTASIQVSTASTDVAAASLSHETVCAYIASQLNGSQIKYEDITQIDEDYIEEMDIKWSMALLSMRADMFWKRTGKKIIIQGSDVAGFDKSKVECFNCHKMGHFARECRAPRSQEREENHALVADDKVSTEFALMAKSSSSSENKVKKEKEGLNNKLTGFESTSKDLDTLLGSQRSDKNKEGIGYSVVPPPPAQVYSPPKKDLSWTSLPEFFNDTITDYSRPIPSIDASGSNTSDLQSSNFFISEHRESSASIMSKSMIKFVKAADCPKVIKTNKIKNSRKSPVKYAEIYRNTSNSPKVRVSHAVEDFSRGVVFFVYFGAGIWYVEICICTVFSSLEHLRLSQDEECCFFLKFVSSGYFHLWSSIFVDRSDKGFLFGLIKRDCKRVPTSSHRGNSQNNIDDKGYWDSGSSRHMTGNICYLSEYEPYDGGFASFGQGEGKIIGKGIIKTDFKLKDDTNVLLRTSRQHNMYSIDLNNIVPHKNLTCLVAKAFVDEKMNEFCTKKGIKREFSNARTPLQNRVAERRNRTLIEAARTMLADAKLPVTFWAEAVNTACYVQNRVLVNKSQNKTPYELFNNRIPAIGFLRPFGCHVMILNTLDLLGKFDAKGDEGYFVGYSMSSKAFRVFNKRTKKVEENLHVDFLENKLIEKGAGPNWLFDIDTLTNYMTYVPVVVARTSSTNILGTKEVASQDVTYVSSLRYIALLNWFHEAHMDTKNCDAPVDYNTDVPENSRISNPTASSKDPSTDQVKLAVSITVASKIPTTPSLGNALTLSNRFEDSIGVEADLSNMESSIPVSPTPTFKIHKDHPKSQIIGLVDTPVQTRHKSKEMEEHGFIATIHQKTNPDLLQFCQFSCFLSQEEPKKIFDALKVLSWVEAMQEELLQFKIQNVWILVDCPKREEGIDYEEVFAPVARIEAIRLFLAYASFMGFIVYQMDVKSAFLYGTIDEEVYVMQHPGFQDPEFPDRVYKVEKAMYELHQAPRAWYGTLSKYLLDNGFQRGTIDQTLFIKKHKGEFLLVQVPDIMFVVCACVKHQVTPKECHLYTVKRIFRYLKGHPKLGLWYPKDSSFDLVAYLDSDYGGATQDRKSTTRGCQFLGRRLISWQCKKQTIMATSTTKAEYVVAASGCGQVLQIQNKMLDYGNFIMAKLDFCDYHNMIAILEKTEHNIDFHQIVDFLEASHISNIATAMVCLDTNRVYNFLKMIFDGMGEGSTIQTEPHHTPSPQEQHSPHHDPSSPSHPTTTTEPIPQPPTETPTLRQYSRRATRIAQSKAFFFTADEHASLLRDDRQGETFPTVSSLDAGQDRENINKISALPYESSPRVTSLDADESSMQQILQELMDLCTSLQRQQTQMAAKIKDQDLEISGLKAKVKFLEDRDKGNAEPTQEDAPIKGGIIETGEEVRADKSTELGSNDTDEMVNVLSSMEAVSVSPVATATTAGVPTVTGLFPTASVIFTTTSMVTPYSRRSRGSSAEDKGKEKVVKSEVPKKTKLQEQIDAQVAREMEEQFARENQRMNEQLARDSEIARLHAEEVLKMMIDGLDRSNEVIAKHLQEYEQAEAELTVGEKIELINELVKYQDHHDKILKYQAQQSKPLSKKEQREFYMSVRISHAGWKTKHFRGMTLEQIKEKFIPEELKEMMQLVPLEEVYVEALQVKHPIIDWEIYSEGQREYWKIIRLGGHTAVYQFFVDMLKQFDREDLHQLWNLMKKTLTIKQATKDKEKELWVELKRLFEPDFEDQLVCTAGDDKILSQSKTLVNYLWNELLHPHGLKLAMSRCWSRTRTCKLKLLPCTRREMMLELKSHEFQGMILHRDGNIKLFMREFERVSKERGELQKEVLSLEREVVRGHTVGVLLLRVADICGTFLPLVLHPDTLQANNNQALLLSGRCFSVRCGHRMILSAPRDGHSMPVRVLHTVTMVLSTLFYKVSPTVGEEEVVEVVTAAKMLIDNVIDVAQVTTTIADIPVSAAETIVITAPTITAESTKTNVKESTKKDEAETAQESSSKRERDELEQERSKKQKVEDDKEYEELKKYSEIIPDDGDDVTFDAIPLSSKSPTTVDYKIYKEGKKKYF